MTITSTTALVYRMVIAAMAGERAAIDELYSEYVCARHLHVTIAEILESKKMQRAKKMQRTKKMQRAKRGAV